MLRCWINSLQMKNQYNQSKKQSIFLSRIIFQYSWNISPTIRYEISNEKQNDLDITNYFKIITKKCIVAILGISIFWIYCYLGIWICLQCVKNYEWCALLLDNDQVQQSPMYFNRLQYLERLFIDSSVSCTSPQQCLPRMKNDVKLHKGKALRTPSTALLPFYDK